MTRVACLFILLIALGCGGRGGESETTAESVVFDESGEIIDIEPLVLVSTEAAPNVETLDLNCEPNAQESCNARDEDCNGVIDEGCGYGSGHMQITMAWDTGSDVDLYVTDPAGETLSFQRPATPGGGRVDHSGRGDCADSRANSRVENVRWVRDRPLAGEYRVVAHYWGECVRGGGPTTVVVSIAVARQTIGSYRYSLLPGERAGIAKFSVK